MLYSNKVKSVFFIMSQREKIITDKFDLKMLL